MKVRKITKEEFDATGKTQNQGFMWNCTCGKKISVGIRMYNIWCGCGKAMKPTMAAACIKG